MNEFMNHHVIVSSKCVYLDPPMQRQRIARTKIPTERSLVPE